MPDTAAIIGTTGNIPHSFSKKTKAAFAATGHNTGNLAFQYAAWRLILNEKRLFSFDFDPDIVRETCQRVVLPAANFLYSGFDLGDLARRLEETGLPVVVLGLGAQAINSVNEVKLKVGTERLLRVIAERCKTIAIRGKYTAQVLERYKVNNFKILGCPSNFINPNLNLGKDIAARLKDRHDRVAFCPTFYSYNANFEAKMYQNLQDSIVQIVCQDPISAVALARGDLDEEQRTWLETTAGFLTLFLPLERQSLITKLQAYFSVDAWMESYRGVDAVVGSRIHGVNLGWQAERAGLVVSFDLRTEELADTMGIPWIKSADLGEACSVLETLSQRTISAAEGFDDRRGELADGFVELFLEGGLLPSEELKSFIRQRDQITPVLLNSIPDVKPRSKEIIWGFLEQYNRKSIAGWVDTNGEPDVEVVVSVDDHEVGRVVASSLRPDLGPNARGFQVTPPEAFFARDVLKVDAIIAKTGQHLKNSPVVSSFRVGDEAKVLRGKAEYLFLQNDANDVLRQISGERNLTRENVNSWTKFFLELDKRLVVSGSKVIFLVAPAKECVFSQFLPDGLALSENRPVRQIESLLKALPVSNIQFSYPLASLRTSTKLEVYPKGDSHWTDYGAAVVFDELWPFVWPNRLNKQPAADAEFKREFRNADLLSKLGGVCVEPQPVAANTRRYFRKLEDNGVVNTGRSQSFCSGLDYAESDIYFLHDSYGDWLIPYLAEASKSLFAQWGAKLPIRWLETGNSRTILIERAERFLLMPSSLN